MCIDRKRIFNVSISLSADSCMRVICIFFAKYCDRWRRHIPTIYMQHCHPAWLPHNDTAHWVRKSAHARATFARRCTRVTCEKPRAIAAVNCCNRKHIGQFQSLEILRRKEKTKTISSGDHRSVNKANPGIMTFLECSVSANRNNCVRNFNEIFRISIIF